MKRLAASLLVALPLVTACAATSGPEYRKSVAWNRCASSPGPDARASCIKTQIALMEAADRSEAQSVKASQEAAEDRQAKLEAHGVPADKAKQTTDSGLKLPK
ncbi:hypothetical protein [Hyphomonas johnsonii]|uniref:Lipoprotein n=1 Tax=Hyphomonas johnsonii MHS-2 TaxID=1280950 RepID=A0A059FFP6_9PROT|nr:hypothetical protein [Hyphomonas johnsonii]KCZ89422.1 hypothetical protein HJO_14427 [Hyphomonas johnsonii MHS-2]